MPRTFYERNNRKIEAKDLDISTELEGKIVLPNQYEKKKKLDREIRGKINDRFYSLLQKTENTKEEQTVIENFIKKFLKDERWYFKEAVDRDDFITNIVNDIFGLGILEKYLEDNTVEEIWVRGTKGIYYEKSGKRFKSEMTFKDDNSVLNLINKILAPINRKADESNPIVDGRLADGSRVAVTLPPISLDGPQITIRKFKKDKFLLSDYIRLASSSKKMAEFLSIAVQGGLNILVAGGTGSGKTTLLNALSSEIPIDRGLEHIITVEDSAELIMFQDFVSGWETKNANTEGQGEIKSSALLKHSLRNSPDRIILGEMRDDVAYDVLQAVNTGHDGTMSTIHCESPRGAVERFSDLASSSGIIVKNDAMKNFGNTFDLIVYVDKVYNVKTGNFERKITAVTHVVGSGFTGAQRLNLKADKKEVEPHYVWLEDIYRYNDKELQFETTGYIPKDLENRIKIKGYSFPLELFARGNG